MDWPNQPTECSAIHLTRLLYTHAPNNGTWTLLASNFISCKQPRHAIPMDCSYGVSSSLLVQVDTRSSKDEKTPFRARTMHRSRVLMACHPEHRRWNKRQKKPQAR
jgi:hypothetical protein